MIRSGWVSSWRPVPRHVEPPRLAPQPRTDPLGDAFETLPIRPFGEAPPAAARGHDLFVTGTDDDLFAAPAPADTWGGPYQVSVTPEDAVAALLQPGKPGYMQPVAAAREAFDDVKSHQIAVMAGVQAALMHLLRAFDPTVLEERLQAGSKLSSLIPGACQARLWDLFRAAYGDIARDADSDFQRVFGREFARAYNEQARSASAPPGS